MSSIIKRRSSSEASGIQFPHTIVDDIMQIYAGYPDHMGTSMYYDIINHQPLEVEAIQGFIFRQAKSHNVNTPHLDTVYALLRSSSLIIEMIYSLRIFLFQTYLVLTLF